MSIIPLEEAKKVYEYEEVMGQEFWISIPRKRSFISLKEINGKRNQTFSTDEMPEGTRVKAFGVMAGSNNLVCYGLETLIKEFWFCEYRKKDSYTQEIEHLDFLCDSLFGNQEGIKNVRSIYWSDYMLINQSKKWKATDFWLPERCIGIDRLVYFEDTSYFVRGTGFIQENSSHTFQTYFYGTHEAGIRPAFVLSSKVEISNPSEPDINWVKYQVLASRSLIQAPACF